MLRVLPGATVSGGNLFRRDKMSQSSLYQAARGTRGPGGLHSEASNMAPSDIAALLVTSGGLGLVAGLVLLAAGVRLG